MSTYYIQVEFRAIYIDYLTDPCSNPFDRGGSEACIC